MMRTSVVWRPELTGFIRASDERVSPADEIVVHRNTVSTHWHARYPGTASDDLEATYQWHRDPTDGVTRPSRIFPYHFFIDDGPGNEATIYQIHTLDTCGMHAHKRNPESVGIALNVDGRNDPPSEAMQQATVWLLAVLLNLCPHAGVTRHRGNGRYQCPGPFVLVEEYAEAAAILAGELGAEDIARAGIWEERGW